MLIHYDTVLIHYDTVLCNFSVSVYENGQHLQCSSAYFIATVNGQKNDSTFSLNQSTGALVLNEMVKVLKIRTYEIEIMVVNIRMGRGSLCTSTPCRFQDTITITVNVLDVNDHSPVFNSSYNTSTSGESTCIRGPLYTLTDYHIGSTHIHLYPAQLHSIPFAVFASLIAPFGGFFASGLKRAFQIKDFADVIPGHGGIMDRFDCQILMATFSNVYYFTFLRTPHPEQLLATFFALPSDQQLFLYRKLEEKLLSRGQLAG
eukprot:Em0017g951a